jgi:Mg-chelatase subunit ChlD
MSILSRSHRLMGLLMMLMFGLIACGGTSTVGESPPPSSVAQAITPTIPIENKTESGTIENTPERLLSERDSDAGKDAKVEPTTSIAEEDRGYKEETRTEEEYAGESNVEEDKSDDTIMPPASGGGMNSGESTEGFDEPADAPAYEMEASPKSADTGRGGTGESSESDETYHRPPERQQRAKPLQAGEVDDNADWDDYLSYSQSYRGPLVHDRDVSERYVIDVRDEQGQPILDALVRIYLPNQHGQTTEIYQARTYATGQTLFHPLALGVATRQTDQFFVEVSKGNSTEKFTLTRLDRQTSSNLAERRLVKLDTMRQTNRIKLDMLFLIDATGSMDDEIAKIQDTVFDVTTRIDVLPGRPEVRYGMVTYRDRDDTFVSRAYEFTPNVREFADNLDTVYADGGGDYPESLNEALHKAIHNLSWREADTIKLIFLIADAPPHLDYAQDYDYAEEMEIAAQQGIKIFPIASSGLDDQGEYIFRQLAQFTQGRFIFLTYADDSNAGPPGEETTHHVDDYTVEHLDDLLVNLVTDELAYQSSQQ